MSGAPGAGGSDDEIAGLEARCGQLEEAIDQLEHEARRCRDKLERAGGQSRALSAEIDRLERSSARNRRELQAARRRINALKLGSA